MNIWLTLVSAIDSRLPGPRLNIKPSYLRMVISMLKIRRPLGRLIFNMGIAIPGKTVFLIETAPWLTLEKEKHHVKPNAIDQSGDEMVRMKLGIQGVSIFLFSKYKSLPIATPPSMKYKIQYTTTQINLYPFEIRYHTGSVQIGVAHPKADMAWKGISRHKSSFCEVWTITCKPGACHSGWCLDSWRRSMIEVTTCY